MSTAKIINLGLPKSGTTTLGEALRQAGLSVADWRIRRGQSSDDALIGRFVGDLMYADYFASGDPLATLAAFDAVTEVSIVRDGLNLWPQTDWGLLHAIQTHHPDARFVLTHRDPKALVSSMLRWSNLGKRRLPQSAVPGLPRGYGSDPAQLERWVAGHYAFCRQVFQGSDAFLEYDIADPTAPARISAFLGIDLPWWGQANENLKRVAGD